MHSQELGAANFAELLAWMIGARPIEKEGAEVQAFVERIFAPSLLPGPWGGAVPR